MKFFHNTFTLMLLTLLGSIAPRIGYLLWSIESDAAKLYMTWM